MKIFSSQSINIKTAGATDVKTTGGEARQGFDSPWKKVIESYFRNFIEFFFPLIDREINWERGFEFLDKEFQQAVCDAASGTRLADKLVKVWTTHGQETWVLIHIEVQNQKQNDFARRMYVYNYRIYDHYKKKVASLAILGDRNLSWRSDIFRSQLWECEIFFKFPVVKLMDYEQQWPMLEKSNNPFAIITMAHLLAQRTYSNNANRFTSKLTVIRHLFKQGYSRDSVIDLFIFIDWVLRLPDVLEQKIRQEVINFEENKKMQYVTSFERFAKQEGIEQGIERGLEKGIEQGIEQERKRTRQLLLESLKMSLEIKFGKKASPLLSAISQLKSPEELIAFQRKLKTAQSIDKLQNWLHSRQS